MELSEVNIPTYTVDNPPDDKGIGKLVDDVLKELYLDKSVLVRAVASSEHKDKTLDELIEIISKTGTDRYDPNRMGDRYENVESKHIDLFAFPAVITKDSDIFAKAVWGFYHSAIEIHGYPMRIDIAIVYDAALTEKVPHRYAGRNDIKDDGFKFKNPENKSEALLGIVKIT